MGTSGARYEPSWKQRIGSSSEAPGLGLGLALTGERGGVLGSAWKRSERLLPSCPGLLEYNRCPGLLLLRGRIGCVRLGLEAPPRPLWISSSIGEAGSTLEFGQFQVET